MDGIADASSLSLPTAILLWKVITISMIIIPLRMVPDTDGAMRTFFGEDVVNQVLPKLYEQPVPEHIDNHFLFSNLIFEEVHRSRLQYKRAMEGPESGGRPDTNSQNGGEESHEKIDPNGLIVWNGFLESSEELYELRLEKFADWMDPSFVAVREFLRPTEPPPSIRV